MCVDGWHLVVARSELESTKHALVQLVSRGDVTLQSFSGGRGELRIDVLLFVMQSVLPRS